MISFPRKTIRIGNCLAMLRVKKRNSNGTKPGEPIIDSRPILHFESLMWKGNRLSYHLNISSIPRHPKDSKRLILHTCDNEWCLEPKHLYLGTQKDNVKDMYERHPTIRQNISKSGIGRKVSIKTRKLLSLASMGNKNTLGRYHTKETKKKISISNTGKECFEKTRQRLRAAWKRRKKRGEKTK